MLKVKNTIITILMLVTLLCTPIIIAYAGNNNNNDDNGQSMERGTGKINGLDGCRPGENAGDVWIFIPSELPPGWSHEWLGAPCCANRAAGVQFTINDAPVYLPNQCCNPPDDGDYGVPGNHCECFSNRGYPIPNALP